MLWAKKFPILITVYMDILHKNWYFYHFAVEKRLLSSTVVGSFSYYSLSVPSFITTVIDATINILEKSIHSLSTVIGPASPCLFKF